VVRTVGGVLGDPDGELGAGGEAEFGQDAFDVAFGGALGDDQPGGDFLVGQALRDQIGDLPLAPGEDSVGGCWGRRGCSCRA
jgi:hypothetical protein